MRALGIPEVGEKKWTEKRKERKKEELKSMLTMVNVWTNIISATTRDVYSSRKIQGVSEKMDLCVFVPILKKFTEPKISYILIWE